ncbi:uncharacterized protein LOC108230398 [Kryptolebias marmoratus]|uniref:Uncharacterized LOC108230398 n=1 Tax=Kryptolebias marmoratus TaxID=37003 RepID=A0A3Q3G9Q1_KRYMA|nr:uncharacterized protein LOC108230398 [Kryptolebias marmoratus]
MPTPKRGSAPHDTQPKVRKLDEDGEAPPSKIESATNSLKTETKLEKTAAAPRTKKKRPSVDEGNKPAKLSKQSSPPKDSSKPPPDPPVNKANLLNATSASCGEAPSQRANSKVSLKRTASTESDDDEDLSSDGSKVDFFRERDDEDKARCVRKYSNKVKAKRRAEESSFDPQEMSEDLSSSPLDPVQIDHNYGRFSESASLQNTGDAEDKKDSAESFTEQERQEISHDATQKVPTDISISETGSTETSVKIESATEEDKDGELQYPESQTLMDNKTPASSREMTDCVTPLGEENDKKDETESIKSQKDADNKTLASPEKTLCSVTGELHSSGEGAQLVDERTDSLWQSESQTHLSSQSVSEENLSESVGICAGKLDGVVLNETNSAPDQVEISNPKGQTEENVRMTEFVTISDTQIDLSDEVASKEEFDAADIQAEMTDAVVSSCDDVKKTLEKSEDKFEESASVGVDFQSPQTSACPDALVEVHLNHGVVTSDNCTETLSKCIVVHKENQTEMLSENVEDPEGQITTEVVLQSEENHLFSEKVTKVAAQSEGDSTSTGKDKDSSIQCSAAEIEEDTHASHPDVTVKTQSPDDFESTTNFHEDHVEEIFKTMENKETVGAERGSEAETPSAIETHTVVTPEISHSEPPGEMQKQGIQEVSESTTATSTEIHGDVTAEKCEHMETVECAVAAEGQDGIELHPVAAFKPSDIEAKVELQIQKSPVSEHNAVASIKSCHDAECDDSTAENLIEVDIQTADMLEEVCTQIETHSQTNQEVRERTICDTVQKVLEDANCAPQSQTEVDALAAASSEEVSNIAHTEEIQLQMIGEPTTDLCDKAQKDLEMADCVSQSQTEVVEDVQASATSEKVSNIAPTEEMQTPVVSEPTTEICAVQEALENTNCTDQSQVEVVEDKQGIASSEKILNISLIEEFQTPLVSEPTTDVPDEARTDLENAAFKSSKDVKCVSAAAQSQIEVYVDAAASEDVSNVAPTEEMQSQMVSEPTTDTTVEFLGDHREESLKMVDDNEFKCESLTVTQSQMEVETTLTKESSNPARLLDVNKIQTEEDMQAPENTSGTTFVVETQTQKILDVSGQTTDGSNKELHENKMVENLLNVKNEDKVHFQCANELESEMQITPASVISAADPSEEMQKSQNEIDMQNVTTSEQDSNIPAVEMQNLKSPDVNENNTERQSVTNEESQNKMETSETLFSPPSAETQIQRSFNVTDSSTEVSEQVQESLRIPTNECLENENKAVEECVFAAGRTNKMETQAAAGLQENSQPTTTEQTQSQRGQAVSELTADTNISVSPPSAETEIQKRIYVTEPANDSSETIQESFEIPPNETNENENELTEECVDAAEMTNEVETQTAEMLDEVSQPTTTEQTQSQRGQEVSELTTDTGISASQLPPETQIQRSFDISDPAVEVSEIVQEIPSNKNKAIEECVCTTDSSHKIEMQAAGLQEISQPTTIEPTQSQEVQEASELTTDISDSPPSSEIQIQKSLDTAERTDKIETEAAKMLLEVSQPTTTEERQNPRDQEFSELTTDTNISVSPSSSETWIQKNFSVPDPASDISETVRESFSISSNEHCENENKVIEECADTAERTDEMETQPAEVLQEIPLPTVTEQIQKQKSQELSELITDTNLSVSPPSAETQVHEGLDVIETAANISEAVQESFPSKECHENKEKATEECADTAEGMNEMQMQTTETVEQIFQPATAEQTQNQRQQEVSELTTDADIFVSPPSAETEIQKRIYVTEPVNDSPEGFKIPPNEMNENENKAIEEYVDTAESTDEMETQTEVLQEISQPTITEQVQNQRNQEFSELTTDTEVKNDSINTESEQSKNSVCVSEDHPKTDMQTSVTPEIYYQKSDVELQNQINEVSEVHKNEDKDASECENVPETESNMETSAESEEMSYPAAAVELKNHLEEETSKHTANLSDEILTPHSTANLGNKANDRQTEPEDVISGPKEGTDSALEEDIKVDASVSNAEGGGAESSEVIVFVCDQSDDTDVVIQAPEERIKTVNQSEVEFHENQVVYEPISSPESNSGGEVCTTIQLGETISFLELQSAETHHILGEESGFLTCDDKLEITHPKLENEEIVKEEICTSVVLMEVEATHEAQCPAHARLERSNTTEDVKHIAAVSSSDISAADGRSQGATEKSERRGILECISAAEVTEQVRGDTEVNDATGTEVKTTDASAEDYVILEPVPVPESEIHFDIVTQAAAESGLSASLGPDEEISQKILSSSQQTVTLEPGAQQVETTHEVKDTTVTIPGEVLEQETETNSLQDAPIPEHQPPSATVDTDMANAHHTNEDSNAAVMENVESTLDQEEVQILEDIEIGREVVLAEEDNEEDGDVVVIKPPDQPTEGSPKESEEKVNDNKKKQETSKTVKEKKSAEKLEDEKKGQEVERPKKQEMNMQARTKARLAALAEQKAAAAKRSANRQQLNLLALCQEIAEDIATDSMLLKKIEEEKQAAAAAEAAKAEAIKKEHPAVNSQEPEPEPDNVVTPAVPEESSASVTPTPEPPTVQPSTADSAETKPAAEPPKRRFFISQISVPLKAHEKKKLTRYQRLRQVELQREKMSWARVKKLKSDQANQMFSDVDWQASFSGSFLMSAATPPPATSPSKPAPVSPATTAQPAQPKGDSPKTEAPTSELVKTGVEKTEPIKTEKSESELVKIETTKTEPPKTETSKTEPAKTGAPKTEPVKAEVTKSDPPNTENRRITRQSKAQASQAAAVTPKPAPKVTRSSKRALPAVPPPMPNGLNAQKQKPVEYKPYRPRPKYSFDDFELDDDDSLLVSPKKMTLPTQLPRPGLQPSPSAQSKPSLKPTISSQPASQAKLKSQMAPPGQISGQSRPTAASQAHLQSATSKPPVTAAAQWKPAAAPSSKPVPSTSAQLKPPLLAASQSKPASASAQPKPAVSASAPLKTAGVNETKQFTPTAPQPASSATTEAKPAAAKADDASVPQEAENPPAQENGKCKNTADPLSSLPASSLPSVASSDDTKKCEESPADTTSNSSAENKTKTAEKGLEKRNQDREAKPQDAATFLSDASLQKEVKKLKETDKDSTQTIIDAGQKHFGPVACSGCGMLYSAANPEDESQHLLFHNQFISAVKYVGWKKERILAEYPDGKIILVLPDDPKYALKKVEEIREMVDNDLGFQQVETKCPSQTKTFLFISVDKKVAGCLIAEHIQEGYRVIEEPLPEGSEGEKVLFERQKAWCCSTTPEPAICGISRIWVVGMMRRQSIATRMIECLRNNFIYGSYLRKDEIAFSDPTPDGKLFASHYFGTSQFLVYNFVSGPRSFQPKTQAV